MNKKITVFGVIFVILGAGVIILSNMDILALEQDLGFNDFNSTVLSTSTSTEMVSTTETQAITGIYNSIRTVVILDPLGDEQTFSIRLVVLIPDFNYDNCLAGTKCSVVEINDIVITEETRFELLITESSLVSIPVIMPGLKLDSTVPHQYFLEIDTTSNSDYSFRSAVFVKSRIFAPVGLIVAVIGVVVSVLGFIRSSGSKKYKPLPTRPTYEPSIGASAGAVSSSKSSRKSKKSKKSKPTSSQRIVSNNCKKCNGAMPRNAQYCPHCYTRQ